MARPRKLTDEQRKEKQKESTKKAMTKRKLQTVVLLVGDEEYRSEEALPMLARILAERHGFRAIVLFSHDDGVINPNNGGSLAKPEALDGADAVVLDVRGLCKSFYSREGLFGKREFKAVEGVSFRLAKGKTLGLVGESGSGKTTVGLTLMRLHEATSGEAIFIATG